MPGHAEHQVRLLGGPLGDLDAGRVRARTPPRPGGADLGRVVQHVGEGRPYLAHDGVVVEIAGSGHDHRLRAVLAAVEAVDRRAADALDRVDRAEDGAAQRGVAEHRRGELVVDDVAGVVVVHGDLLEDDAALGLDVLGADQRIGHHVADDVDGQRQVDVEHPRVVAGVLLGGEGVQVASDRLDGGGDLHRGPRARALEQQVLEVVGRAHLGAGLVAGADVHPHTERDRADARHLLGDHAQAAREGGAADESAVTLPKQRAGLRLRHRPPLRHPRARGSGTACRASRPP